MRRFANASACIASIVMLLTVAFCSISVNAGPPLTTIGSDTQTFSQSYEFGGSHDILRTIEFPQFNPAMGTLNEIRIEVEAERWEWAPWFISMTGSESALMSVFDPFTGGAGTSFIGTPGGELTTAQTIPQISVIEPLPRGYSVWPFEVYTEPVTVSGLPKDLGPFVGTGTWEMTLLAAVVREVSADGVFYVNIDNLKRHGTVHVTFVAGSALAGTENDSP